MPELMLLALLTMWFISLLLYVYRAEKYKYSYLDVAVIILGIVFYAILFMGSLVLSR